MRFDVTTDHQEVRMVDATESQELTLNSQSTMYLRVTRDQQFRVALVSRDIIGQAEAFGMLKQMSQDSNTPIAQVAQRVTGRDSSLSR
jgi:hypothetical protein